MSRAGYCDDLDDPLELGRWRAQVRSATRGKRGQKLLRDLLAALDAMPKRRLVADVLEVSAEAAGDVCALGALGRVRGLDMSGLNPDEPEGVAAAFDIASPLAREIVYMNDEHWTMETPEQRWQRMRAWIASQIVD